MCNNKKSDHPQFIKKRRKKKELSKKNIRILKTWYKKQGWTDTGIRFGKNLMMGSICKFVFFHLWSNETYVCKKQKMGMTSL